MGGPGGGGPAGGEAAGGGPGGGGAAGGGPGGGGPAEGESACGEPAVGEKLKGADCRTVINDAGEREFTDLSETEGLTPWQIETMDGDRGVILPDHLTYPEDWPEPPESTAVPELQKMSS